MSGRSLGLATLSRSRYSSAASLKRLPLASRSARVLRPFNPSGGNCGGRSQLLQFDISLAGFCTQRHGDVQIAQNFGGLDRLPGRGIGPPQRQFQIGSWRLPVFLQNGDRILRPVFRQQRGAIQNVRIAQQQRLRILFLEITQSGDRFRRLPALKVGRAQIKTDVVTQISRPRFGAIEGIHGFGIVLVEDVRISQHQPGQRARIFLGVTPGVGFHSSIGGGSAVLQQLLRHRLQTGGGNECRVHPARPGRGMAVASGHDLAGSSSAEAEFFG